MFIAVSMLAVPWCVDAGWYVGTRNPPDTIQSSNVILSYINPETSVTIPAFFGKGMYFVAAKSVAGDATNPHFTWTYVAMPTRTNITPNSYLEFYGVGSGYSEIGTIGDQRVYSQKRRRNWSWGTNGSPGYSVGSVGNGDTWTRPQMLVKARLFDGGDLTPGIKELEVPLRIAQVAATNDQASINAALAWANANIHKTPYVSTMWKIRATITPKCWIDNTDIRLNFAPLSKSSLEGQVSSQGKLSINCNTPTDVDIDLVPVDPLPAISKGATVCGDGLACIVEFDGQQNSIKYHSLISKSITITSKLRVIDLLKIREGEFEGNAILRVNYN